MIVARQNASHRSPTGDEKAHIPHYYGITLAALLDANPQYKPNPDKILVGAVNLTDRRFDRKLIQAIYTERGRKDAEGRLVYFAQSSPDVRQGVARRFVEEERDALAMLETT
jgi:hypothetical protein